MAHIIWSCDRELGWKSNFHWQYPKLCNCVFFSKFYLLNLNKLFWYLTSRKNTWSRSQFFDLQNQTWIVSNKNSPYLSMKNNKLNVTSLPWKLNSRIIVIFDQSRYFPQLFRFTVQKIPLNRFELFCSYLLDCRIIRCLPLNSHAVGRPVSG